MSNIPRLPLPSYRPEIPIVTTSFTVVYDLQRRCINALVRMMKLGTAFLHDQEMQFGWEVPGEFSKLVATTKKWASNASVKATPFHAATALTTPTVKTLGGIGGHDRFYIYLDKLAGARVESLAW